MIARLWKDVPTPSVLVRQSHRLLPFALLIVAVLAFFAFQSRQQFEALSKTIEANQQIINHLTGLMIILDDAETAQRGFLLTGQEKFLQPLRGGRERATKELASVLLATGYEPEQHARAGALQLVTQNKFADLAFTIALFRNAGAASALRAVGTGKGKQIMDDIRARYQQILSSETNRLAKNLHKAGRDGKLSFIISLSGSVILFLLLAICHGAIGSTDRARQRAEKLLIESENKFRTMFDVAPFGIIAIDGEKQSIVDFNTTLCVNLGYTREEFKHIQFGDLVALPLDQIQAELAATKEAFSTGRKSISLETEYRNKAGELRKVIATTLLVQLGGRQHIYSAFQDVTERRLADAALRESEIQFRTLANAIPHLCWIARADGWIFWYNQRWYDYTGTTPEQMEGWGWESVHQKNLLPEVLDRFTASIETEEPFEMIFPLRRADGEYAPFLTRMIPIRDASGRVTRWFGTNTDIREQSSTEESLRFTTGQLQIANDDLKVTNEALRTTEATIRSLLDNASDGILTVDLTGRILSVNLMAERLFRYSRAELIGSSVDMLLPESVRGRHMFHRANFARQPHGRPMGLGMELAARRKDGTEFPVEISLSYVTPYQETEGAAMAFISDISVRTRHNLERQTIIASLEGALSEKTVLLKEVHHRVKNNLAVVAGLLGMQAAVIGDERLTAAFEVTRQRVSSMALVHEYLYATEYLDRVNFGKYTRQLANELKTTYGLHTDRVVISVNAAEIDIPLNIAIPCGLILNELISNSYKHAFPNGRRGILNVSFDRLENGDLLISCRDDGVGISENVDWRTRHSLGLEIVQILTRQIDGQITKNGGKQSSGTEFVLTFPSAEIKSHVAHA